MNSVAGTKLASNNSPGDLVGRGHAGAVYEWSKDNVVKLFYDNIEPFQINREFNNARLVSNAGLPVPKVYDQVKVGDQAGIVFQRIQGTCMQVMLAAKPWLIWKMARRMAKAHSTLHQFQIPRIPFNISKIAAHIRNSRFFTMADQRKLLSLLFSMPQGYSVCHGGFLPQNLMVCSRNIYVVDWNGLVAGNPAADVADTIVCLKYGLRPDLGWPKRATDVGRFLLARLYRHHYLTLHPSCAEQLDAWIAVMAASRIDKFSTYYSFRRELMLRVIHKQL